tara:strand:+ start:219 stop:578 length:360 start_codon:yes stop_codon:yes gene_type:complete
MKLFWLLLCVYAVSGQAQEDLTINQLQFVGSHNSYKLKMNPFVFAALSAWDSKVAQSLDYSHIAIDAQLEMGVRKLELDVFFRCDEQRFDGWSCPAYLHEFELFLFERVFQSAIGLVSE